MELQPPQIKQEQTSQEIDNKLDAILKGISSTIERDTDRKEKSQKELKELLSTLNDKFDESTKFFKSNEQAFIDIKELQQKNIELSQTIQTLSNNHQSFISTNNQDRKWLNFAFLGTALGLSINFIMFAYLWYHTHK